MSNLKKRLTVLEGKRPTSRSIILPFPPEDGETPKDIERKLAEWTAREPLTEEEWAEKYGAEDCRSKASLPTL